VDAANDSGSQILVDPQSWLERHGEYLFRFAVSRVRQAEAAEDLVQETLLAAWKGLEAFAGEASERTWLTSILKRKVVDWLRRKVREQLHRILGEDADRFASDLFDRRGEWKASPGFWIHGDPSESLDR
jgi:RNA polymerase sigma-70 factor (ECF subfamily)